jgi:hypothetical protein
MARQHHRPSRTRDEAGRPGISVRADLGATCPSLLSIVVGLLAAGVVFGAGAGLLITAAPAAAPGGRQTRRVTWELSTSPRTSPGGSHRVILGARGGNDKVNRDP